MDEFQIVQVPAIDLIGRWDVVEPLLAAALPVALGRYWPIDVLSLVIQGALQAWFVKEGNDVLAVIVTRVEQYPRRRGFNVFALSGSRMNEWFERAEDVLTAHARQMGCDHFELHGRPGWKRVLDLEPRAVFLVKDLNENDGGAQSASSLHEGGDDVA